MLGGHTLNQGSVYGFVLGANAAARDQLQHALPLVYTEPDLALSVLRNTCAWATPQGDLPYALGGDKRPMTDLLQPSDQNLWAFWLAAEYAAATGYLAAFDQPLLAYQRLHGVTPTAAGTMAAPSALGNAQGPLGCRGILKQEGIQLGTPELKLKVCRVLL